ncbi:MAG: hypothetical protein NUW02_02960 [Candidatus Campbellbacteria bacterium]|nr:hypothetical protein [Candidatus Campbellbacteria bacterium]
MKKSFVIIFVFVFVGALGVAFYFYREVATLKQNPQAVAEEEAEELVKVVGKLIILPKDEVPTIATVSDPEKLKDQPFFAKAKIGDKVLIYAKAQKAYLYDPIVNRILEVAPISVNTDAGLEESVDVSDNTSGAASGETE